MEGDGSERNSVALRERLLLQLAKRDKSDMRAMFHAITESSAFAIGVARVGIWRFLPEDVGIVCEDMYYRNTNQHERGAILLAAGYPAYFKALHQHRVIAAHDALTDPRTIEYSESYLRPHGIASMLDVPIWDRERLYGVLCHEQVGPARRWTEHEVLFAGNMADLVTLTIEEDARRVVERNWKAVVETIAEAVFVTDAQDNITMMNPLARELFEKAGGGVTAAERRELLEYRDLSGRLIPFSRWPVVRSRDGEIVRGEVVGMRLRKTGEERFFRISSAPIRERDKQLGTVSVLADISEEAHFEQLKRDFLSALAHELKTPVAIAKGYAQYLVETQDVPAKWVAMLRSIDRATLRMTSLIEDLVEASGITLGRLVLTRAPVELSSLAGALVSAYASAAPKHRVVFSATESATALIDRVRVEQALRKLIDNGIRYSQGGGQISVEMKAETESVVFTVQDQGIGIPRHLQRHVFELFFRAHAGTEHDVGGLGIGLFLARQIAIRHGGEMWFESIEGEGSSFYLRLPRVAS